MSAQYAPAVPRKEQTGLEDELKPILPGAGASDYERYLRTDELLALQKPAEERAHHDELLFQVVHQSSELWLKLAWNEIKTATGHLQAGEIAPALRLLRRSVLCLKLSTNQLDMRNAVRRALPDLGAAFHELRRSRGLSLVDVYRRRGELDDLYELAEALTELDERATVWRIRHLKVVERIIGGEAIGTQGTPVELLVDLIRRKFFPELWSVRNELTELAKLESG